MTLAIYLLRRFARSFLVVAAVFVAILYLIDMVEQIRRSAGHSAGLGYAARLAALNLPSSVQTILPLIVLLAGVMLFLGLSRSAELVAIRASGRSALRMLGAPALGAALVGLLALGVLNPLVAASSKRYKTLSESLGGPGAQTVSVSDEAVWLRQAANNNGAEAAVIRARSSGLDGTTLYGASFLIYGSADTASGAAGTGGLTRRIEAETATLTNGAWALRGVTQWPLGASTINPQADASRLPALNLPTSLTIDRIREGIGQPSAIPVWQLPSFIRDLEKAGFSARRYQVWFQSQLALPALLAGMLMIAAAFTLRPTRFGGTGAMIMGAIGTGLGVFFLRNLAQVLGENGDVPALLAASVPPVAALTLALGLILHLEDG